MALRTVLLIAVACFTWRTVLAADRPTYESLWNEITHDHGCVPSEQRDYTMFTCDADHALWYFTKPSHPAHPGVVKRAVVQENEAMVIRTRGWSFAPDADQPKFKTWLEQFKELDARVRQHVRPGQQ